MVILYRILSVIIGYVFGLFQTGYIYGKSKGIDIRQHGSGNSGTTNTLRTLGWKAGAITFVGDCLKCFLAMLVAWLLFRLQCVDANGADWSKLICMYAGFGAVLGHNYPFYLKFKGGKGIACTSAMILGICPLAAPICLIIFVTIVLTTHYVSLGSILVVLAFIIQVFVMYLNGWLGLSGSYANEYVIIAICFTALAIWRHRTNIVRLIQGNENKFGSSKKE